MKSPARNLPPDAERWGRYVDKTLEELVHKVGLVQTNVRSTIVQAHGIVSAVGAAQETAEKASEVAEGTQQAVSGLTKPYWGPRPPENPVVGQQWFDTVNGNALKIWVDYGSGVRRNHILNPTFSNDTRGWEAVGGTLETNGEYAYVTATSNTVVFREVVSRSGGGLPWSAYAVVAVQPLENEDLEAVPEAARQPFTASIAIVNSSGVKVSNPSAIAQSFGAGDFAEVVTTTLEDALPTDNIHVEVTVSGLVSGDVVRLDTIFLEQSDGVQMPYFDGSLPGVDWEGEPHYSVSYWDGVPRWARAMDLEVLEEALQAAEDALEMARGELAAVQAELDQRLTDLDADLGDLNDTVLPALRQDIATLQTDLDTLENTDLPALRNTLTTLQDTTIPALQGRLDDAEADLGTLQTDIDTAESEINTLKNTTLPGLQSNLQTAQGEIDTLKNTTIPGLSTRLTDAESAISSTLPDAIAAAQRAADTALLIAPVSLAAPTTADGAGRPVNAIWTRIDANGNEIGYWRWDGAVWRPQALTATVIPNLSASKITSGTIATARLNAQEIAAAVATIIELNADRITSGTINTARLNASEIAAAVATIIQLNADRITSGTIDTNRLNTTEIAAATAAIQKVDAGNITVTGTSNLNDVVAQRISSQVANFISLNADKITSGTINTARLNTNEIAAAVATVIQLNADRITSGTINTARLNTTEIAAQVATVISLNADRITSGTIATARLDVNDIWAKKVASRKVYAEEVLIGRGDNLVVNGTGINGDNTNFSSSTFDGTDAPVGAYGSFNRVGAATVVSDELIPVDPSRAYRFSYQIKQKNPNLTGTRHYGFVAPYDSAGFAISPTNYMYRPGTTTTLAQPLRKGDTVVHLTSAANWTNSAGSSTHFRRIIFWNYTDRFGKVWPAETYSREFSAADIYADGAINYTNNTITLRAPWSGNEYPAGHPVSNGGSGSVYLYIAASNAIVPTEWTTFSGELESGVHEQPTTPGANPTSATTKVPPGTAAVKIGWILTYQNTGVTTGQTSTQSVAAISFTGKADASLIVDGAITAEKITASESMFTKILGAHKVTASNIDTDSLIANTAFVNGLWAQSITVGNKVPTSALDGTITNAQIATGISGSKISGAVASATNATNATNASNATSGSTLATAVSNASTAKTRTDNWIYTGQTTIDGGKIQTDTVTAGAIKADAITAKHTLTGALIRTAATGQRVEMDSYGLAAYNPNGSEYFSLNQAEGGTVTFTMHDAYVSGGTEWFPKGTLQFQHGLSGQRAGISWFNPKQTTSQFFIGMPNAGDDVALDTANGVYFSGRTLVASAGGTFGANLFLEQDRATLQGGGTVVASIELGDTPNGVRVYGSTKFSQGDVTIEGGLAVNRYVDDTGWLTLPLASGWSHDTSGRGAGQVRRRNGLLYFRGAVVHNGGANPAVPSLPGGLLPDIPTGTDLWFYAVGNAIQGRRINLRHDGVISLYGDGLVNLTSGQAVFLNGAVGVPARA